MREHLGWWLPHRDCLPVQYRAAGSESLAVSRDDDRHVTGGIRIRLGRNLTLDYRDTGSLF